MQVGSCRSGGYWFIGLMAVLAAPWWLGGCGKSSPAEWPPLKPPFADAVPKAGVFQYDPSAGLATADKEEGRLCAMSRIPAQSGQRQLASAELMLDNNIYFTTPQNISLSAIASLEWKLVAMQPHDIAWVQGELKLENMSQPGESSSLVLVRQLLNLRGQAAGEKHLFNVQVTIPAAAGRRYRLVFVAQSAVEAGGEAIKLSGDRWKSFTTAPAEVLPASQVQAPDDDARMHNETRAEVKCTLHYLKMR
jgi:hypothetical protein